MTEGKLKKLEEFYSVSPDGQYDMDVVDLVEGYRDMKDSLEYLQAQSSEIVGSTKKADCMAAYASITLRNLK